MNHEAYPLDWPETEPRTGPWDRRMGSFKVTMAELNRAKKQALEEMSGKRKVG